MPLKVVCNWKPENIDNIIKDAGDIEFHATDDRNEFLKYLPEAEVMFAAEIDFEIIRIGSKLKWIQAAMGGVEKFLLPELVENDILVSSFKGCFDIPAAEHAFMSLFALQNNLYRHALEQAQQKFDWYGMNEIYGKTIGIIGLGRIGKEIARIAKAFNMNVIAVSNSGRTDSEFVDEIYTIEQLHYVLGKSDFAVIAVPMTSETKKLISEPELKSMKPTGYLIDISGRTGIYDMDTVYKALYEKWIAGADFQIPPPEPNSKWWSLDNLIISTRTVSDAQFERCMNRFADNLKHYINNEPLEGIVDKRLGY